MFDYLQKFNSLPQNLRDSVSSPAAMSIISELENKYKIDLAATVMKVMVKIIPLADLSIYFVSDFSLDQELAKKLTAELKERLFFPVANYLGYNASYSSIVPKTAPAPAHLAGVEKVIKDSGVVFAGIELNSRFKNILTTYIKGVRNRVDTRLTLNKDIASGGLGLDHKAIDKIFKSADELLSGQMLLSGESLSLPTKEAPKLLPTEPAKTGLDKVRELYEKKGEVRDIPYDLKTAILTGAVKKPAAPFNLPAPEESKEKLLEAPEIEVKEEIKPVAIPNIVKPIETKPIETKPPVVPVVTAVKERISVPVATPAVAPHIPVEAAVSAVSAAVSPVAAAQAITSIAPKIVRPPEKKPGLFSKLFEREEEKKPSTEIKKPVIQSKEAAPLSVASLRTQAATQDKQIIKPVPAQAPITEIKSIPKVMGPIEELKYLDLTNFRRLGSSPAEAVAKIEAKIKLLEKDGYDKMVSGVLAWREGLINSIYLKMGQEALAKGQSLKQCADNHQINKNPGFLIWPEIEAIIDLNSKLMF